MMGSVPVGGLEETGGGSEGRLEVKETLKSN